MIVKRSQDQRERRNPDERDISSHTQAPDSRVQKQNL